MSKASWSGLAKNISLINTGSSSEAGRFRALFGTALFGRALFEGALFGGALCGGPLFGTCMLLKSRLTEIKVDFKNYEKNIARVFSWLERMHHAQKLSCTGSKRNLSRQEKTKPSFLRAEIPMGFCQFT